ncbi:glycosyltransferase family 61 protein [Aeromonas salmonicida]|uniref:glycosyltransferase family 61 protein n=1 Tax=Aeromonas salmonicida TaxID=645 RepID=UPI003CFBE562
MIQSTTSIEFLHNGRIAPLTSLTIGTPQATGSFDGGVYYSNNQICLRGLHGKTHYTNKPVAITQSDLYKLDGCHIFGGMLQEHFGHFLTESIGRIWAQGYLSPKFNSIAFYHRVPGGRIPGFVRDIMELLAPRLQINIIQRPTIVEELAVPTHVEKNGMLYGHSSMREAVSPLKSIKGGAAKRLYVSRSRLNLNDGGVLFETLVEKYLEAEGYQVIHPEKMTLREQVAAYNGADELIFAEGSALHLYALVARSTQRVFIIWRRKLADHFGWQISTFGGPTRVHGEPCIDTLFVPTNGEVCARALLDFDGLSRQLREGGFISNQRWDAPKASEVSHEIARVELATKRKYLEKRLR